MVCVEAVAVGVEAEEDVALGAFALDVLCLPGFVGTQLAYTLLLA